jgi:hypothetical protein
VGGGAKCQTAHLPRPSKRRTTDRNRAELGIAQVERNPLAAVIMLPAVALTTIVSSPVVVVPPRNASCGGQRNRKRQDCENRVFHFDLLRALFNALTEAAFYVGSADSDRLKNPISAAPGNR